MKIKRPDFTKSSLKSLNFKNLSLESLGLKKKDAEKPDFEHASDEAPSAQKAGFHKPEINFDVEGLQRKLKNYDWRSLQKFTSPQAAEDLNVFLEKLPQNAGKTMLIIAGVVWGAAGAAGLFTTVQLQKLTEIRIALEEAEAIKPMVPQLIDQPVSAEQINQFVEKTKQIYTGLDIKAAGQTIVITSLTTNAYGQFREAIGHVQNGGSGWRVTIEKLCVGRECQREQLSAALRINTVSVNKPV